MTMTRAEVETSWGTDPGAAGRRGSDGAPHPWAPRRRRAVGRGRGSARRDRSRRSSFPDLPLGAHSYATAPGADLTPRGIARLVDALARELVLHDVTLVGNDTGGAICQMVAAERPPWLAGLVLTPCDAYENFLPPAFRPAAGAGAARPVAARRAHAADAAAGRPPLPARLRLAHEARASATSAPSAGSGRSSSCPATRRDVVRTLAAIDSADTVAAAARLGQLDRPVAIAWADGDRFFPRRLAERLAGDIPGATLTRIDDAYAFTPIDQPEATTELIAGLVARARSPQSQVA